MFKDIKYHILSSHPVNFLLVNQTRPDFNLVYLILELAFLFHFIAPNKQMAQLNVTIITCQQPTPLLHPLLSDLLSKHERWHEFVTDNLLPNCK